MSEPRKSFLELAMEGKVSPDEIDDFVEQWHLTQEAANKGFAWIPQVFSTAGGFFGGWLAFRWIRGGARVIPARMKVCWI